MRNFGIIAGNGRFPILVAEEARKAGATRISIDFVESEKNAPAKDFVEKNFAGGVRDITEGVKAPAWVEVITR